MTATFSPCRTWRYRLDRSLGGIGPRVAFLLHNPSIAAEETSDPTATRGIGYATAWDCSHLTYINPWAAVATKKADLWKMADPVGPDNNFHIVTVAQEVARSGGFIVFAWGAVSPPIAMREVVASRLRVVEALVRAHCSDVRAIGVTKDGAPRHPLMMRADALPVRWP